MNELPEDYFKFIAEHLAFISVFLGGISATILGTIILHKKESKILNAMIIGLSLAAVSFIVAVIGMNKIQVILEPNYPFYGKEGLLDFPRLVGVLSFYIGIFSLLTVIGLTGWMKSRKIGVFTAAIAIISGILVFFLT